MKLKKKLEKKQFQHPLRITQSGRSHPQKQATKTIDMKRAREMEHMAKRKLLYRHHHVQAKFKSQSLRSRGGVPTEEEPKQALE